jgi:serine/threonine protein kinase
VPNNVDAFLRIVESRQDIDGRFKGLRRVGPTGGNGVFSLVFRATDQLNGQDVAIKVFRPDCTIPYRIACFQREAQILETLRGQPDIIGWVAPRSSFIELTTTNAGIVWPITFEYYALELAESDIGSIIENGGWNIEQTLQSFHVMCRAVQRIHLRGIAHRDLKPSNFLVMPDGSVKLSDFGTARDLSGMPNAILQHYADPPGDSRYASPEMITCLHDEDPQIAFHGDIFSLGSILFELITGTCLGVILDPQFHGDLSDLLQAMRYAQQGDRRRIYDQLIGQIADSYPLPGLVPSGARIPAAVVDHVEKLYKSMAALSFRVRLNDFNRIFLMIRTCLIILRNDQQYQRWRANRDKYRHDREERRRQLASRARFTLRGN